MARRRKKKRSGNDTAANLGFEEKLWQAADKMRGHMDAAEYKHVALGLIFLKYISDSFEGRHTELAALTADPESEYYIRDPEARYEVVEDRHDCLTEPHRDPEHRRACRHSRQLCPSRARPRCASDLRPGQRVRPAPCPL